MAAPLARDIIESVRARRLGWNPFAEIDIRFYGAVPGTDITALITKIGQDGYSNIIFPSGAWVISSLPTIPASTLLTALPGATFSGTGASLLGLSVGSPANNQIVDFNPAVGQLATFNIFKNPHYTGGTPGFTPATLRIQTNVGANVADYEWGFLSILNNSATGGQNVAIYGQGNKLTGAGPTWAGVFEVQDKSGAANPTTGMVAVEIDCRASGTDSNSLRVGLDLVCSRYPYNSGIAATIGYGYRVGSFGDASVTIGIGYSVLNTTCNVAFDCSNATIISGSLRMAQNVPVLFDVTGTQKMLSQGFGLDHFFSGALANRLLSAGGYQVGTLQVIGQRITGWGVAVNGSRAALDGAAATLAQTSAALAQVIIDLTTHGLIGP